MSVHQNIVQFFGIHISSTGEQYIVTEYLSGGSLDSLLRKEGNNMTKTDLIAM
jgi:serine/threonine protein kinase